MTTTVPLLRVRGACPHDCPDTCATITEVENGRAVRFYADPQHPITDGWLCAKVRPYLERVYHPDRLTHPLRRVGPKGSEQWQRISWDEAIGEITSRWQAIIAEYGAAAILPYSYSGTLGVLQAGAVDQRLWNRMGASGLDRAICCAASHAAVYATIGARHSADYSDLPDSRLIVIWGHNPATAGPHAMPFIRQAQRNGTRVIVIDPRRSATARSADQHLQLRPATDAALALGVMHVIFRDNLHDEAWLNAYTVGWQQLRERAADYPPERVAAITGLSAETITAFAREYATTTPAVIKTADGVQRHQNGGQTFRSIVCLPALTGQYGRRGGGLSYSTGGYASWDEQAMGHSAECPPPPRRVNMNRLGAALTGEVNDPPIKALFVYNSNPVTSSPNAGKIVAGLMRDDLFTVVHELFMTDTARYADIVLPATSQLEQVDLHRAYGHRFLQYNNPAIEPLAECKSNWDVMRLLAAGMGYQESWLHESAEEALRGIIDATRAKNPFLADVTLERLQAEGTVALTLDERSRVPFSDLHFPTPSGKVELFSSSMQTLGLDPLPGYVEPEEFRRHPVSEGWLHVISGAAHHFVTSSMANQRSLLKKEGEPYIEISAADAAARGIQHGQTVLVENARGACQLRAVVSDDVVPGTASAPKGFWGRLSRDGRNINWTTSDALADLAGQSTFHSNAVRVSPLAQAAD